MVKLTDKDKTKQNKTTITKPPTAANCVCCKYENGIFCECAILFPGWLRIGLERLELGDENYYSHRTGWPVTAPFPLLCSLLLLFVLLLLRCCRRQGVAYSATQSF